MTTLERIKDLEADIRLVCDRISDLEDALHEAETELHDLGNELDNLYELAEYEDYA